MVTYGRHEQKPRARKDQKRVRIAITGSSGMIGSALIPALTGGGHEVVRLVRRPPRAGEVQWDPQTGGIDAPGLEGVAAVVNLAGENIATRWTDDAKRRIRDSRIKGTSLIADTMARLRLRPEVLISVSAVGFYGDRGDEVMDETSRPGEGFLPRIAQEWEGAAASAAGAGIRVATPRLGIVLSPAGGALAKMLPVFRLGLGGTLGSGGQWMSWVSIDDVIGGMIHLLDTRSLQGPVNIVAPAPVRNRDFTHALARVLSRPAFLSVPAPALHVLYGRQMADEALLGSTRVTPARLVGTGYNFRFPDLEGALKHVLAR